MNETTCPQCGGQLDASRWPTAFRVCPYCQSTLERTEESLKALGKVAHVQPDLSPIQIGTTGSFKGKAFDVLGRIRRAWEDGSWNEWYIEFTDGTEAWLSESQGEYHVTVAVENEEWQAFDREDWQPGGSLTAGKTSFLVTDRRETWVEAAEGMLPYRPETEKSIQVDLVSNEGAFLSLEFEGEELYIYQGFHLPFDELNFKNLRELDGWKF